MLGLSRMQDPAFVLEGVRCGTIRLETPEGCSPELASIIDDCLAHQPVLRPSFSDLTRRFAALDVSAVSSAAVVRPESLDLPSRRQRRISGVSTQSAESASGYSRGSLNLMRSLFPRHVGDALMRGEKVRS